MADTLKQFSNHSAKTLSELTAGVTLVTTSGSEKAVIKSISVENANARKVDIRLGSITGTKIADGSKSGTLGGNEILDNSQTLVANTSSELVLTDIIAAGWGENDDGEADFPKDRSNADGIYVYPHSDVSTKPVFTPDSWRGYIDRTNGAKRSFPASSDDNARGKCWGESFEDKFGNLWIFNTSEDKDFEINGADKSDKQLYKLNNNAANTAVNNLKTMGGVRIGVYDGERYIYVLNTGWNYMKKYDTWANPDTDNSTQVSLYDCSTSDTTALTADIDERGGTGYYRDGYIVWTGGQNTNAVGRRFCITEVATGKTKMLFDTKYPSSSNDGYGGGSINHRRSLGLTKDSNGDYFAFITNWGGTSNSTGYNFWCVTNLGNDPKTTYIPNSVGTSAAASAKKTYEIDMWSVVGTPGGGSNDDYITCYRLATMSGARFDAPRGFTWWTPGIDRYCWVGSSHYSSGNTGAGGLGSNRQAYRLDFDKINDQTKGGFCTIILKNVWNGSVQVRKDTNQAADAFGTVSIRTTGILVT